MQTDILHHDMARFLSLERHHRVMVKAGIKVSNGQFMAWHVVEAIVVSCSVRSADFVDEERLN